MELNNYSFFQSKRDHIQSNTEMKVASDRLFQGNRFESGRRDVGAPSVEAYLRSSRIHERAEKINFCSFHSFLQAQSDTLSLACTIYDRMGVLALRVLDPTINERDNQQFNKEIPELLSDLDKLLRNKVNGKLLFGGKSADITNELTDTNATDATPLMESRDVQATIGKIPISRTPGVVPDQIWVLQGELPSEFDDYFDSTTYLNNGDILDSIDVAILNELNSKLYSHFETHVIFTTGALHNEGFACDNNFDTFEVVYDSCDVEVSPRFDDDNSASTVRTLYESMVVSCELMENIPPGDNTFITTIIVNGGNIQIYKVKASFTPTLPFNDFLIPFSGQAFPAISFGNLGCSDMSTEENRSKALSALDAETTYLTHSIANIAAAQSRYQNEIESLEEKEVSSDISRSRISGADFAKEAINLTKSKLKPEVSAQIMSKSSRMKDLLIPLTTNHFSSHALGSKI